MNEEKPSETEEYGQSGHYVFSMHHLLQFEHIERVRFKLAIQYAINPLSHPEVKKFVDQGWKLGSLVIDFPNPYVEIYLFRRLSPLNAQVYTTDIPDKDSLPRHPSLIADLSDTLDSPEEDS